MSDLRTLSHLFLAQYEEISKAFGGFQQNFKVLCPRDCGHCCIKHDIHCAPYELLPMAFYFLDQGIAESYLELSKRNIGQKKCVLLNVLDEQEGRGHCSHYAYRPFICRAFGVSARHSKNERIDYSVCKLLKEDFEKVSDKSEVPFIEILKKQFENLDPHLMEPEVHINEALMIALEKVLLWNSYQQNGQEQ